MKRSERILLVVTIGLGAVLVAAYLPGRGRMDPGPGDAGGPSAAVPASATTETAPPALELQAAGRVELTPLPARMRNPFRSLPKEAASTRVAVVLQVTAVFGEQENRAALLRGERLRPGAPADGPVIRVDANLERVDAYLRGERVRLSIGDAELVTLLRGKLVRAGDSVGTITIEGISPRGVTLRWDEELISVDFQKRGGDQDPFGGDASGSGPGATKPTERRGQSDGDESQAAGD
jgi:hypothetical protein